MPLYEYHCQACGKDFERRIPIDERCWAGCPDCEARASLKMSVPRLAKFPIKSVKLNGKEIV